MDDSKQPIKAEPRPYGILRFAERTGSRARAAFLACADVCGLITLSLRHSRALLTDAPKRSVFLFLFKRQLYNTAYKAASINCIVAILIGVGLADRGVAYLQKLENFADLFVVMVVREIGPLISGVILIARSATAVTAEIGYLQLNNEFRLIREQGLSPFILFLLPVFFSFPLSLLLMLVYFNVTAAVSAWIYVEVFTYQSWAFNDYLFAMTDALNPVELFIFAAKAFFCGIVIGLVSLYSGYQVGDRFTDISRTISNSTTIQLLLFFVINIGLSIVAY